MKEFVEEKMQRVKRVQDFEDDSFELDATESHKLKRKERTEEQEDDEKQEEEKPGKKDTKVLLASIGILLGIFVITFLVIFLQKPSKETPTIDELHEMNIQGKLKPTEGHMYNGFSFVKFGDLWYSQLQKESTTYDVSFNNHPKEVENITVTGALSSGFIEKKHIYITFDPTGHYLPYVGVANYGISRSLAWAFGYNMTAGCTENVTKACEKAGIVLCGDPGKSVIYIKETEGEAKVTLNNTCVVVEGAGPEIVRAKDRLLLRWYGMMH